VIERHTLFLKEKEIVSRDAQAPETNSSTLDIDPDLVESFLKKDVTPIEVSAETNAREAVPVDIIATDAKEPDDATPPSAALPSTEVEAKPTVPHLHENSDDKNDCAGVEAELIDDIAPIPSSPPALSAIEIPKRTENDPTTTNNSSDTKNDDAPIPPQGADASNAIDNAKIPEPCVASQSVVSPKAEIESNVQSPQPLPTATRLPDSASSKVASSDAVPPVAPVRKIPEIKRPPVQLKSELVKFQTTSSTSV
jgi:hypothetical protein